MKIERVPPKEPEYTLRLSREELAAIVVLFGAVSWTGFDAAFDRSTEFQAMRRLAPSQFSDFYKDLSAALKG